MGNIGAYKNAKGNTDKLSQIIMLYDTAIASLHQAKEAIEAKNIQERYNKIERAYLIISGLRDCLDFEVEGEISEVLKDWYTDTAMRIVSINKSDDISMCDLCISTMKRMREAWIEVQDSAANKVQESEVMPSEELVSSKSDEDSSSEEVFANDSSATPSIPSPYAPLASAAGLNISI